MELKDTIELMQIKAMTDYMAVLEIRAVAEGIEL